MTNLLLDAAATPANTWWIYILLIGLVLVMLIVPSITNRKRVKEYNQMINGVKVGDTVRTVGGVIGRITKINEKDGYKTIILETGAKNAKTTMEFDMASIGAVIKSSSKPSTEKTEEVKVEEKAEETKTETTVKEEPSQSTEENHEIEVYAKPAAKKTTSKKTSTKKSSK